MKRPCIDMLASARNGVLYIGVTSDLAARMSEHDQGLVEGFTKKYGVKMLVYYEFFETMPDAIQREKRLKDWQRAWKVRLIHNANPEWQNFFDPLTGEVAFLPKRRARAVGSHRARSTLSWVPAFAGMTVVGLLDIHVTATKHQIANTRRTADYD